MDSSTYVILIDLPLLALVIGVVGAVVWNRNGGSTAILGRDSSIDTRLIGVAAMFALWLLVSLASIWLAFLGGLMLFYALLFWLGQAAAWVGAITILTFLVSIPFLWGWALLKWGF